QHVDFGVAGCSDSDDEFVLEHDDEEVFHSDFKNQVLVMKLPEFANPINWPGAYELGVSQQELCKHDIDLAVKVYANTSEAL
ncbi:MHC class II alpha chain, partial [Clarias magur]